MSARDATKAIQALQRAMAQHPHQRVGQMIDNARWTIGAADLFYMTDEALAAALDAYVKAAK